MSRQIFLMLTLTLLVGTLIVAFSVQGVRASGTVGVKAGDWIKYDYTVTGALTETPIPTWMKVEILSVEGSTVTVRLTMRMPNGTEGSENLTLDVARTSDYGTGGTFDTFFGFQFVIPANSTARQGVDFIYVILLSQGLAGTTNVGETTRTYVGASRTVVSATFGGQGGLYDTLKCYWDKPTGAMVEASATRDGMTAIAKATETNMWQAIPEFPSFLIPPLFIIFTFLAVAAKRKATRRCS
jgi:hypothetical protein